MTNKMRRFGFNAVHSSAVAMIAAGLLPAAIAHTTEVMPDSVVQCLQLKDDVQRLICFDREVGRYRSLAVQTFGLTGEQLRQTAPPGHPLAEEPGVLDAAVAAVSTLASGAMQITLSNEQVWVQLSPENIGRVNPGDHVRVRSGVAGSFFLYTARQATRVRRIR